MTSQEFFQKLSILRLVCTKNCSVVKYVKIHCHNQGWEFPWKADESLRHSLKLIQCINQDFRHDRLTVVSTKSRIHEEIYTEYTEYQRKFISHLNFSFLISILRLFNNKRPPINSEFESNEVNCSI